MGLFERLTKRQPERPAPSPCRFRPRLEALETRLVPYAVSSNAWPNPQMIRLSFIPDGTILSSQGGQGGGYITSNLFATFNAKFGSPSVWENQILKAAQVWAQQTNLNFSVVPDDGEPFGSTGYEQGNPNTGDIRIGGYNFGSSTLALTYMPPPVNNYSIAGDMQFNTGQVFNIGTTYDLFTVAAHEIGHALGLYHSGTVSATMYSRYTTTKQGLSSDDIAGIRDIYSKDLPRTPDVYNTATSNGSFATAANLTTSINFLRLTDLVQGLDITNAGQPEYFTFAAPLLTTGSLAVTVQSSGLSLLAPKVTVYAADQTTVLGSASGAGHYGTTLTVTVNGVTAGQQLYVVVSGADTTAFGTGRYDLGLNFGPWPLPAIPSPVVPIVNTGPTHAGGGQAIKLDAQFQISPTTTATQQTFPQAPKAVALDANGNSVVTWSAQNLDGSWTVYAQRYDAAGDPLGGPFAVSSTGGNQEYATVAMDPNGDSVITWSSDGQDGSGWGVYAQRYNAAGVPQGGAFQVNTTTAGDQMYSNVAMDANGSFVITWSSSGQDGSGWGVYAQRYNAAGVPQGGEFRVHTTTAGDQMYSTVAMDLNGDFVITWSSNGQDGSGWGVYAQRYNAAGVPQRSEFRVNTTTAGDQEYSTVARDANGSFVITWSSSGQDGSGWGVYAQRYNAAGLALGGELQVNTTTAGDQEYAAVAMSPGGSFIITWSSSGQAGAGWGVFAQQYDSAGNAQGSEFQVNTTTVGDQRYSSLALDGAGDLEVVWSGRGGGAPGGVFGRRFVVVDQNAANAGKLVPASDSFSGSDNPIGGGCNCPFCQAQRRAHYLASRGPSDPSGLEGLSQAAAPAEGGATRAGVPSGTDPVRGRPAERAVWLPWTAIGARSASATSTAADASATARWHPRDAAFAELEWLGAAMAGPL